jgi:hypothetical protein
MSEDLIMMLIRIAVIVFPAAFACFIVGFLYGRASAVKQLKVWTPPAIDEPDFEPQTVVTKRNRKVIL